MEIIFKKSFIKQYAKLKKPDQRKVDQTLEKFEEDPQHPQLKNHALIGKLAEKRAISAGFDLRIIFELQGEYLVVTMISVGSHSQVY